MNIIDSNIQPILITPSPISFSEEVTVTRVVGKETSIDSSLNSIITNTGDTICIIFEGVEYDFLNVPGDGNCFYYSLLKKQNLQQMFINQKNFRKKLVEDVKNAYDQNIYIPSIFRFFKKEFDCWC